jgi:EamA domain-containing membrane protein RarD
MIDKSDRRLTWIIEVSVSIYLYVLLSLTEFMGENTFREELGWVLVILTAIIVAINILVFIWRSICKADAYIKQRFPYLFN